MGGDVSPETTSFSAPGSAAYSERWLVLEYVATARGVDVRADTFFAARFARASGTWDAVSVSGVTHVSSTLIGLVSPAPRPVTATVHAFASLLAGTATPAHSSGTTLTLLVGRPTLTLRKR